MFIVKISKGGKCFIVKMEKTIEVEVKMFEVFEIGADTFNKLGNTFICELIATKKDE